MEAFLPAENVTVRVATVADVGTIHRFSVALATYEDVPDAVTVTTEALARDGFGADPKFGAVIAEQAGRPVGFALYTFNYSTWTGARGMFIEDIWVEPEVRRGGVARALIAALARDCAANGFKRIDLHVLDWNRARGFYERVGFVQMKAWLPYRLSGGALSVLAKE
jgi:GNAT superfamily N-acetyltransferase